jgi:Fe-S-cluster containining protein
MIGRVNGSDRRIFALTVDADYACRHSGACCTAGWSIPVEPLRRGLLGADVLAPQADGACGYFDRETRLCRVHRDHGPAMRPASCHHFPRRALGDDRGLFVTLSHFCPTAAGLLFRADVALEIVRDPRAFPPTREYEGLDGRGEWPPLVRPDLLFDLASYDRWERFLVDTFSDERATVVEALARVAAGAERLRAWKPACGPFAAWTDRALRDVAGCLRALDRYAALAAFSAFRDIAATVPSGLSRPARPPDVDACSAELVAPCWNDFSAPVRRYLATKAFGSWAAYSCGSSGGSRQRRVRRQRFNTEQRRNGNGTASLAPHVGRLRRPLDAAKRRRAAPRSAAPFVLRCSVSPC